MASVWWRWTPTAASRVRFDTLGSDFDTLLGVYEESAPGTLVPVTANDDASAKRGIVASSVEFAAETGHTYAIAVDGYNAAVGLVLLNWSPVEGPPPVEVALTGGVDPSDPTLVHLRATPTPAPALDWSWELLDGPGAAVFASDGSVTTNVTSARVSVLGTYIFRATGSMGGLIAGRGTVAVNVGTASGTPRIEPAEITVAPLGRAVFTVLLTDQFGRESVVQAAVWRAECGVIDNRGAITAPATAATCRVEAATRDFVVRALLHVDPRSGAASGAPPTAGAPLAGGRSCALAPRLRGGSPPESLPVGITAALALCALARRWRRPCASSATCCCRREQAYKPDV